MKKHIVLFIMAFVLVIMQGCGKTDVKVDNYEPVLQGDVFQQNVKGNIVDGYQWEYEIKNNHMITFDDMVNFYDMESKTEIGDFFYFFNGISEGDDEIIFKLVDTKDEKVFCEIKYNMYVDKDNIISLKKREVKDNRGKELINYTYDDPQVRFQEN